MRGSPQQKSAAARYSNGLSADRMATENIAVPRPDSLNLGERTAFSNSIADRLLE